MGGLRSQPHRSEQGQGAARLINGEWAVIRWWRLRTGLLDAASWGEEDDQEACTCFGKVGTGGERGREEESHTGPRDAGRPVEDGERRAGLQGKARQGKARQDMVR